MKSLDSRFKPVGQLDFSIMEQSEEVNALLLPRLQQLQNQIQQSIIFTAQLSNLSNGFRSRGVDISSMEVERVRDFARAFVNNHRKVSGFEEFGAFPQYFYCLEYYGLSGEFDQLLPETAVWHIDDWKAGEATAAHIGPLDMQVVDGTISVSSDYDSKKEFDRFLHLATEEAVQAGNVGVKAAASGEVTLLDSLQCIHRRAPLDTQKISVPFLRHRALSILPPFSWSV